MEKPYLELRTRNTFGDIVNNYFQFLKLNFKHYLNLYLRYNAISIILTLIGSYLLVTGFMGLASRDFRFGMDSNLNTDIYLIIGGLVLVLILFITAILNYSFSSAYISEYVKHEGTVTSAGIWNSIKKNLGSIVLLVLIGIAMYMAYFVLSIALAFIPLLGMLAQYAISFTVSALFGLSFMAIFNGNKPVGEAISEAWSFTFANFIRVVFFGLVIGILNLMLTFLVLAIPGFIIGFYTYFSVESEVDFLSSTFATLVFTIGFAMFILAFIFSQALSQVAYGVLFFNLHEERYNGYLKERIDEIGVNE
ncbi:hypothetical protein [Bizionia myxarmorum]|uniref:Glycerophosphoryl diester phosphodiesterase membrane domain-containing protein n=1 Tax=Bizionia myxarmorum TaxID=291186 RepID=A0A5D0R945_9FLAO|nr:hypothetical protein [Bizionia myxarmorum]TYB77114.1 hypothetical protein ES674_10520 [Bizionia myxarmorum]